MSINKFFRPALPSREQQDGNNFWSIEDYNEYLANYLKHPDNLYNTYLLLSTLQSYIVLSQFSLYSRAKEYYSRYSKTAYALFRNKKEAALQVIEIAKSLGEEPLLLPMMYAINALNYFIAGNIDNSLANLIKLLDHESVKKENFREDLWDPAADSLAGIVHDIRLLYHLKGNENEAKKYHLKFSFLDDYLNMCVNTPSLLQDDLFPEDSKNRVKRLTEKTLSTFFHSASCTASPCISKDPLFLDTIKTGKYPLVSMEFPLKLCNKKLYDLDRFNNYICDEYDPVMSFDTQDTKLIFTKAVIPYKFEKTIGKSGNSIEEKNIDNKDQPNNMLRPSSMPSANISKDVLKDNNSAQKTLGDIKSELDSLVGLSSIKSDVEKLVSLVKMQKIRGKKGLKTVPVSLHLVFTGNPGTGKTTIARILANLYKEIGILRKGQLVEVDRSALVAGYVGQTAIKTQEKINEAMGGILFIDEAYTLVKEGNDYGQEAIDTILKAMEDRRDEFIVIVAGYTEPMQTFINSNPGLKSRFNKFFAFPDYSVDELIEIFDRMCIRYDYKLEENARSAAHSIITTMEMNKDKHFANAREIRNFFESIITRQASRVAMLRNPSNEDVITISIEDIVG